MNKNQRKRENPKKQNKKKIESKLFDEHCKVHKRSTHFKIKLKRRQFFI